MINPKIHSFEACKRCSECCKTPCDIIPSDLPPLLEKFGLDLKSFYKKYLISLIVASPKFSDEVLMMVPVRMDSAGNRTSKFLADQEYLNTPGHCVFLKNNECSIHVVKPFGGRFMVCHKMTGSETIQLDKKHYFAFWRNNQHLFEEIFPGYRDIYKKLNEIYAQKNSTYAKVGRDAEYNKLHDKQVKIIVEELFLLINGCQPVGGFMPII